MMGDEKSVKNFNLSNNEIHNHNNINNKTNFNKIEENNDYYNFNENSKKNVTNSSSSNSIENNNININSSPIEIISIPEIFANTTSDFTEEVCSEINLNTSQETIELPTYHVNEIKNSYGTTNNSLPTTSTPINHASSSTIYCLHGRRNVELRGHCHRKRTEGVDTKARKKLIIASILCIIFIIAEVIGGVLSGSLAIATDAAHLLTDFASFMISLFAIWLAGRPSTKRLSFGWYRAEVIGALASVFMIWVITAVLVTLAVERLMRKEYEVDGNIMLITSGLAIVVNIIMVLQLHDFHGHSHGGGGHSHGGGNKKEHSKKDKKKSKNNEGEEPQPITTTEPTVQNDNNSQNNVLSEYVPVTEIATVSSLENQPKKGNETFTVNMTVIDDPNKPKEECAQDNLNVRAAIIHVIGDILQSVGVFIAALVIYFRPDYAIVDPICTLLFSVIVLFTTINILKDALMVLMEGTPSYLDYAEVLGIFQKIEGVERVHNLRIWALSVSKVAVSVHLAVEPYANPTKILEEANTAVHQKYSFFETTIQIEEVTPDMDDCKQCSIPK